MPDAFGSIMLESNGLSYVKYDLGVETFRIKLGKVLNRSVFYQQQKIYSAYIFRTEVGTWSSGIPGNMTFKPGMAENIVKLRAKPLYKVVTVIKPPFMQWNETTSKFQNMKSFIET